MAFKGLKSDVFNLLLSAAKELMACCVEHLAVVRLDLDLFGVSGGGCKRSIKPGHCQ